ncbi:hypothetical protein DFH06DRAFT_558758 [Mycena polygramma]|nr:hypothetical protein DFH06DRAFT_558758 [Mycena polygramma]
MIILIGTGDQRLAPNLDTHSGLYPTRRLLPMGSPHSFMAFFPILAPLLLLLLCTPSVQGAITNTTVDDADSAFTFTGSWTAVSASNPCNFCSSKPDASQTFDGTWHDGNYRTGASETTGGSFTFTGSAVYIFGIDQAKSQPDIAFTLGSTQSVHHYTGTEQFVYNALFFSATGLAADQTHTVNWNFNIDPSTGVGVQAALFDYAIVTSGTADVAAPPTTQSTTSSTTAQQTKTQTSSSCVVFLCRLVFDSDPPKIVPHILPQLHQLPFLLSLHTRLRSAHLHPREFYLSIVVLELIPHRSSSATIASQSDTS